MRLPDTASPCWFRARYRGAVCPPAFTTVPAHLPLKSAAIKPFPNPKARTTRRSLDNVLSLLPTSYRVARGLTCRQGDKLLLAERLDRIQAGGTIGRKATRGEAHQEQNARSREECEPVGRLNAVNHA